MTHHQESVALATIIAAALILVTVACVVDAYSHHNSRTWAKRREVAVRNFRRWRRDRLTRLRDGVKSDPGSYGYENEDEAKLRLATLDEKIAKLDARLGDRKTLFCEKLRAQAGKPAPLLSRR